jgi:hypothetical protein
MPILVTVGLHATVRIGTPLVFKKTEGCCDFPHRYRLSDDTELKILPLDLDAEPIAPKFLTLIQPMKYP